MNVERAKRLGWIVDNLELQYSQINEIHDEERKVLIKEAMAYEKHQRQNQLYDGVPGGQAG